MVLAMVLQPEALVNCIIPENGGMSNIKIHSVSSIVKTQWVGLHCHGKGDANQSQLANVLDGSTDFPRYKEMFVGAIDDALGKRIC
jgi:hypothetical protein